MEKEKKQFRLFDVYRQFFTRTASKIRGIRTYNVHKCFEDAEISITYGDGKVQYFTAENEAELKQIVRKVNKQLKNCLKPGRKIKLLNGGIKHVPQ